MRDDDGTHDAGDAQTGPPAESGGGGGGAEDRPSAASITGATRSAIPPQAGRARYVLASVLGEGGMALVYEAHDTALDRQVAVKVLRTEYAADADLCSRFLYEARLLGQMDHPGVVPVFAAGKLTDGDSYYAMKKVRGRTLRDILKGMGRREFKDRRSRASLLDTFETVCQTIAYAHSKGIVHRDLKPENIMVDEFGVVLVLDWGLSKKIDVTEEEQGILATLPGVAKGTAAYMAPEQAEGRVGEIDYRTDVFALGIVLYEILTGCLPFSGKSRTEAMQKILRTQPPSPRQLDRRLSKSLSAICMKALSKDPKERYPSARELADDISLYRDHLPTTARVPRLPERAGGWVFRHPAIAASLITALLFLLFFGAFLWHRQDAQRIRTEEQGKHERHLAELEEARREQHLQKTLLAIKLQMSTVGGLGEQVAALKRRADALEPGADSRRLLQHQIEELTTVCDMATNSLRSAAIGLVSELKAESGDELAASHPEVVRFFQKLAVEAVSNYLRRGQYYHAHYYTWRWLRPRSDSSSTWAEDERAQLEAMKEEAEAKIREQTGPGIPLPDWAKYESKMLERSRK